MELSQLRNLPDHPTNRLEKVQLLFDQHDALIREKRYSKQVCFHDVILLSPM